jgi:diguanylate cyclase (GGDEF)-like protein
MRSAIQHPPITLADVQACLDNRRRGMLFPPSIEAAFQVKKALRKTDAARQNMLWINFVYNLFIPYDLLLVPSTTWVSWLFHAGLVTPYVLLTTYRLRRPAALMLRNALHCPVMVVVTIQLMLCAIVNGGAIASQYQYWTLAPLVTANVIQRLDFRFAALSTALITFCFVTGVYLTQEPNAAKISVISVFILVAGGLAYANRRIEKEGRLNYLLQLSMKLQLALTEAQANRDPLTGLSNRRHYDEQVTRLWAGVHGPRQAAVIMLDIDHFKAYNDHYGHASGDSCLQRLASLLEAELRSKDDLAVRFGGEEFLLLLPDCDLAGATAIAERIRKAILALGIPHQAPGTSGTITASMGVHAGFMAMRSAKDLARRADAALYAAKRQGRNQVQAVMIE